MRLWNFVSRRAKVNISYFSIRLWQVVGKVWKTYSYTPIKKHAFQWWWRKISWKNYLSQVEFHCTGTAAYHGCVQPAAAFTPKTCLIIYSFTKVAYWSYGSLFFFFFTFSRVNFQVYALNTAPPLDLLNVTCSNNLESRLYYFVSSFCNAWTSKTALKLWSNEP